MNGYGLIWTDDRVRLLKKLYADRLSMSQIAAELGGISRNAVIGKVHRLGLVKRVKMVSAAVSHKPAERKPQVKGGVRNTPFRQPPAIVTAPPRPAPPPPPPIEQELSADPSEGRRVTLMDLEYGMCKWPYGDPPDVMFCGQKAREKNAYCGYHARIAWVPVPAPVRRRRKGGD